LLIFPPQSLFNAPLDVNPFEFVDELIIRIKLSV